MTLRPGTEHVLPTLTDEERAAYLAKSRQPIPDELWELLKTWWGVQADPPELVAIERVAEVYGKHPLDVLKTAIRYIVQNALWG